MTAHGMVTDEPINVCKHPSCARQAERRVKFLTGRGWIEWGVVCVRHLAWGRQKAEQARQS